MVDKRLRLMIISLNNLRAYFIDFLFRLAGFPVYIAIVYFLWKVILENSSLTGISLGFLVTYYTTMYAVRNIVEQWEIPGKISNDVRQGHMVVPLTKPISYRSYLFWQSALNSIFFLVLYALILFALSIVFHMTFTSDPLIILLFFISMIFAFMMNFAMFFTIGLSAFWMEENNGIVRMFMSVTSFLSGAWIPLDLLSGTLKDIALLSPFSLTSYFQVSILQGKLSLEQIIPEFALMIVWTLIFFLVAKFVWKLGERRYTGYGV